MNTHRLLTPLVMLLIAVFSATAPCATTPDDGAARKSPDEKFEALLASALKEPAKAHWKALRHAFAETSRYEPYNSSWREERAKVGKDLRDGNLKAAEAALVKLLERDRFMRLDAQAMAVALYEKMGETEKARKHREFLEGLSRAVFVPGHGTSFEKPIEVLFVDEEYMFLASLGLRMKTQALTEHEGHKFDMLTTHAKGQEPQRDFYFNIDLPWGWLQASLGKDLERANKPAGKK
jgi:hypothetical protein